MPFPMLHWYCRNRCPVPEGCEERAKHAETNVTLLAHSEDFSELGRFAVRREHVDIGAFKTPTLRDLELTSPYMHNGSLKTLIEVVQFYNRGGTSNSYLDRPMEPLHAPLTSDDVLRVCQTTTTQTRIAVSGQNRPTLLTF